MRNNSDKKEISALMIKSMNSESTICKSPCVDQRGSVVLFGEVLADIFPDRTVLGGAPFNVARHLKAFGLNPILITRLGNDDLRDEVFRVMLQNGMETIGIQCNNSYPTGQVRVHLEGEGHRFEILPMQAYDFIHPGVVRMTALSVNPVLVYFGTLAQRHETSRLALKSLLKSTAAVYDEKTLRQSLKYANIVKLNIDELSVLVEMFALTGVDPFSQVRELMSLFSLEQVLVTCGEEGAWQLKQNGRKIEVGVKNKLTSLVDTVGAGDAFAAVCILGELNGWSMTRTLERANAFAAAICTIRGAVPDDVNFYIPYVQEWGM
jgi:fructokinase